MNTTLQIRIDQKMKNEASKAFKSMGLTLSSGVKLYLVYIIKTKNIPFEISKLDKMVEAKKKKVK